MNERITELKVGQEFKSYRQVCEFLGEEVKKADSKTAQVKEWKRYFAYHTEKYKWIIDKVYSEPLQKVDKRTSNNCKNIAPLMEYILANQNIVLGNHYSMTDLYCSILEILNKDMCNVVYKDKYEIYEFCREHNISNSELLKKYVSKSKSILKGMLYDSLDTLSKKEMIEYEQYYKVIYGDVFAEKRLFIYAPKDGVGEDILSIETQVCNEINDNLFLSTKMSGRQLLMIIYGSENLTNEFKRKRNEAIMRNSDLLRHLNIYHANSAALSEKKPIISYYDSLQINEAVDVEKKSDEEYMELRRTISSTIASKVEKQLIKERKDEDANYLTDMEIIRKVLFLCNHLENK